MHSDKSNFGVHYSPWSTVQANAIHIYTYEDSKHSCPLEEGSCVPNINNRDHVSAYVADYYTIQPSKL